MQLRPIRHGQSPRHLAGMLRQRRPAPPSADRAGCCLPARERRPEPRTPAAPFRALITKCRNRPRLQPPQNRAGHETARFGSVVVAIYGAALRRSLKAAAKRPLHTTVAFAPGLRLTIGQFRVHVRSNALTAMPGLLDFGRHRDGCTRRSDETRACSMTKQQTRHFRCKNRTGSYFFLCSDDSGMHVATWGRTKSRSDHRVDCRLPVGSRAMHASRQLGPSSGGGCESRARCRLNQVFTDA